MDLVRDDVLQNCVKPSFIQGVRAILREEDTRHQCAVKLLPLFLAKMNWAEPILIEVTKS